MSIQVKNLTHIYEKGMPNESVALENISFEVEDGSFLGVLISESELDLFSSILNISYSKKLLRRT